MTDAGPDIQPLDREADAAVCAALMVVSEPWTILGTTPSVALSVLKDPAREVFVARDEQGISGFVVMDLRGLLNGYIQILCVRPDCRGRGLGSHLIRFAEARIAQTSPNVFICVSSFNTRARHLYERLGFTLVGVLHELIVPGHHELLLRKSQGPWTEFKRTSA